MGGYRGGCGGDRRQDLAHQYYQPRKVLRVIDEAAKRSGESRSGISPGWEWKRCGTWADLSGCISRPVFGSRAL